MKKINIYTDGACSGNQNETNIGGWGAILEYGEHMKELYGGEANTTNNRMEMMALINALSSLKKEGQAISVFSDSSYLMNCFREKWYLNWKKNNWKTSKKTPVENKDLWEALLNLVEKHTIQFYRVKGHVNLASKTVNFNALFEKFKEWNGDSFTYQDFLYITEKNNRADTLANLGMEPFRL
ncbi:ribonuclease HI [Sinanaerobacter sp. ZZT-01]|uniref:ribonuclease H family protein n=1 Tax=Sinanaerobacter sp. ZZT-01 TaxID=3111540 RepID=UPI002D789DF6|nr:ribonuclease HI [Sinanaerobacter sp. ZZT-01]WRR94750.1 ribonuclease HI [Sinanaerobacter sp. ZZT-01]